MAHAMPKTGPWHCAWRRRRGTPAQSGAVQGWKDLLIDLCELISYLKALPMPPALRLLFFVCWGNFGSYVSHASVEMCILAFLYGSKFALFHKQFDLAGGSCHIRSRHACRSQLGTLEDHMERSRGTWGHKK